MIGDNFRLVCKPVICIISNRKMPSLTCDTKNEAALQGIINVTQKQFSIDPRRTKNLYMNKRETIWQHFVLLYLNRGIIL